MDSEPSFSPSPTALRCCAMKRRPQKVRSTENFLLNSNVMILYIMDKSKRYIDQHFCKCATSSPLVDVFNQGSIEKITFQNCPFRDQYVEK